MDEIFSALSGFSAYILVAQILVITGLLVALFMLVIRKLQIAALSAEPTSAEAPPTTPPNERAQAETVLQEAADQKAAEAKLTAAIDATKTAVEREWKEKLAQAEQLLQAERDQATRSTGETGELEEKVKYLESKLLEYEILQEEIGALTELRTENERLRQQLDQFRAQGVSAAPETTPVTVATPTPAPTPVAAPVAAPELPPARTEEVNELAGIDVSPADRSSLNGLLEELDRLSTKR